MNNDLISRKYIQEQISELDNYDDAIDIWLKREDVDNLIDNAPTVEPFEKIGSICEENCGYNPQGKYVDISKLRLMTVEECAGHTIDYAMGWKACIEWIKKGGAING